MLEYHKLAEKFKPEQINTLLVAEAPPPNGKTYFYLPKKMSLKTKIEDYRSLPATIFYHYFQEIPEDEQKYEKLLYELKKIGVFLIDICNIPLKITDRKLQGSINIENLNLLIREIPYLKAKIRNVITNEKNIIFLLPRPHYKKHLKHYFPQAYYFSWKEFRLSNNGS